MLFILHRKFTSVLLFVSFLFIGKSLSGQIPGWVYLKNKVPCNWSPEDNFTSDAINRRKLLNIPFCETDKPVSSAYLIELESFCDSIIQKSKWLNAVAIYASENAWHQIEQLPFVEKVEYYQTWNSNLEIAQINYEDPTSDSILLDFAKDQLKHLEGELFQAKNITGKNIIIAIFDAGFKGVNTAKTFSKIRAENRILATKDFIQKNSKSVYNFSTHGTKVLACIGGEIDSIQFGLATKSKFLLARVTPQFGGLKMLNDAQWIAALEWADEQGASVINSSLSFTNQIFLRNEMDGMSTRLSKIANTAASKGIVVVNAAGNEYEGSWEIIGAPADAPEVLTVGSVSLKNFLKSSFSSVGPTSDGRLKPDLCAVGELYTGGSQIEFSSGTSFATPLVTGFVACVQELFPYQSATETLSEMRKAGHLYPYFDYAHGYGIPQASYFLPEFKKDSLLQIISSNFVKIQKVKIDSINFTFEAYFNNDSIVYDVFKELINSTNNTSSLNGYFSILNSEGNIDSYGFDRLRAEVKNEAGLVIENTEEYATEVKDYHFLFNSIEYSTCDSCILRVRFLNDIKDFTLDEE